MNLGHGPALELGVLLARGEYVVTLDVDAFPIRSGWIGELLAALDDGATVAGAHMQAGYAHPCCLILRMDDFLSHDHTMLASYDLGSSSHWALPGREWDVAQRISIIEHPNVHLIEATDHRGPGAVGNVFGGFVYHNAYSTRHRAEFGDTSEEGEIDGDRIRAQDAREAWNSAIKDLLGVEP
jgi:glycosyltransferase involved in cell wall biosynthesis